MRRRPTPLRRRLLAIFEEEVGERIEGQRIDDFAPAVEAAAERLGPYPTSAPWWGDWRALVTEYLYSLTPSARRHLIQSGKMIAAPSGDGEGASGPLQMVLFEWTDYRVRVLSRAETLDAHRDFVNAVDGLMLKRGGDPQDRTHRLASYITADEYQRLYDEHVGGAGA